MTAPGEPYYRRDLALVHHRGFGFHADACAPGILTLLEPVRARDGLVVELGCGSGLLTRYLVDAGHRVIATDASPGDARTRARGRRRRRGDPRTRAAGRPDPAGRRDRRRRSRLNYLPDAASIDRALIAIAQALPPRWPPRDRPLRPGVGAQRLDAKPAGWVAEDWAIVTEFSVPSPDRFVRQMATFIRNDDGSWRRDDERHDNVMVDTARVPGFLGEHGIEATVESSFGSETLPIGLRAVIGHRLA